MKINQFQNRNVIENAVKNGWKLKLFTEVFNDETKMANKIKKEEYLTDGEVPIIDQGKNYIAGYSNEELGFYENIPFLIFGDHTRILKYIDFPSFIGADGVKLLKNVVYEEEILTKYLYYFLKTIEIPNTGYNRHFKYLKDIIIPVPSIDIQIKIISILDKSNEIIKKRKAQIAAFSSLAQSVFLEMFGDPVINPKGYKIERLDRNIKFLTSGSRGWSKYFSHSGEMFITIKNVKNGDLIFDNVTYVNAPNTKEAERTKVQKGDLLISITADLGRTAVVSEDIATSGAYINQHLSLIRLTDNVNPIFLSFYLESPAGRRQFQSLNQEGVKAGLNFDAIKSLNVILPPIYLQDKFAETVLNIKDQKQQIGNSLKVMEDLYNSIISRAFAGELLNY